MNSHEFLRVCDEKFGFLQSERGLKKKSSKGKSFPSVTYYNCQIAILIVCDFREARVYAELYKLNGVEPEYDSLNGYYPYINMDVLVSPHPALTQAQQEQDVWKPLDRAQVRLKLSSYTEFLQHSPLALFRGDFDHLQSAKLLLDKMSREIQMMSLVSRAQ